MEENNSISFLERHYYDSEIIILKCLSGQKQLFCFCLEELWWLFPAPDNLVCQEIVETIAVT